MFLLVTSCTPSPKAIDYGSDLCHYCKMTIVDQQHAAELVTNKGKVLVFDAIECMVPHLIENEGVTYSFILVNNYNDPSALIDAESAYYVISEEIPSPMGAFLSAFATKEAASEILKLKKGELYDWSGIYARFNSRLTKL